VKRRLSKEEKGKAATMTATMEATVRGSKRKGIAKSWMVVLETGESRVEDIDKHSIMRRTGLPARDLRVFDTKLSQPSSILGREKAIIVNLEHIRAIITSNEVLMINSIDTFFIRFLQDLQKRVLLSNNIQTPKRGSDGIDSHCEVKPLLEELLPLVQSPTHSPNNESIGVAGATTPKQLPFEFKALESCIESACTCLEYEVRKSCNI
jgi:magnesium transporter